MPYSTPYPPAEPRRPSRDELSAPATQIVRDREAYLGQSRELGRRLSDDQYELFVSEDPAVALQREFEKLKPQFIALHDVGTSSSLRLLQSRATGQSRVMRLSVRRQGHGVPLATLQFVEITGSDGSTLRAYSTDIDADTQSRHAIARVLVSHARLSVLLFGDLPAHALAGSMQPLVEAAGQVHWTNRNLLMIPLGAPAPLNSYVKVFGAMQVQVNVAPRVARATDAWSFIGSAWNQLESVRAEPDFAATVESRRDDAHAPTEPMGLARDRPEVAASINWFEYVQRCASVKGMISCCVFDRSNGQALAHAGGRPQAEVLQALGERLLLTTSEMGAMMGTGTQVLEATVSYPTHHLLLRALPRQPGVVLHAVLDAATGNIALARVQLQRLDPQ